MPENRMSLPDVEQLLFRVNSGEAIDSGDLEAVAQRLLFAFSARELSIELDDLYSMLLLLGRAQAREHRNVLESYLEFKDPFTVALVLEILCMHWKLLPEYMERVFQFALGVPWDAEEDIRHTAIKVLGEYLNAEEVRPKQRQEIIELLFAVFDDPETNQWTRQMTYFALLRADGKELDELPSECALLSFDKDSDDIDWELIGRLRLA